jgi:hypothetical protein
VGFFAQFRIYLLCQVPGALGEDFFAPLPSVALGKERSVKNLSAKRSLPSAFCRALDKEKHSAKYKSEKIQKKKHEKKIIGGGMHSQLLTHLTGCTFFLSMFELTTSCT